MTAVFTMRTFELGEFTDFWLPMIEDERKTHSGYLEGLQEMSRGKAQERTSSNSGIRQE